MSTMDQRPGWRVQHIERLGWVLLYEPAGAARAVPVPVAGNLAFVTLAGLDAALRYHCGCVVGPDGRVYGLPVRDCADVTGGGHHG